MEGVGGGGMAKAWGQECVGLQGTPWLESQAPGGRNTEASNAGHCMRPSRA